MKKRIISIILAFVLFSGAIVYSPTVTAAETVGTVFDSESTAADIIVYDQELLYGDVNLDGKINGKDNLALQKLLVGNSTANVSRLTCDVSKDGKLNGKDKLSLKKVLTAVTSPKSINNTTVEKAFSSDENAVGLTVTKVGDSAAFFEISVKGMDLSSTPYFAVVWKGAEGAEISTATNGLSVTSATVESVSGDEYCAVISDLSASLKGNETVVEVKYSFAPAANEVMYVDSVIFAESREEAVSFANERLALRTPQPEDKYVRVDFDNAGSVSDFAIMNNMSVSYDYANAAAKLSVSGTADDPWAFLNLSSYGISADEYKYLVITDMVPIDMQQPAPEGEIFFSAGSISGPTAGYSTRYTCFKDSAFHSRIFEMSNASFWNGEVHSLRFDFYTSSWVGDSMYIKSVVFCNSYEAAQKVCVDRNEYKTNVTQLFDYGFYDDGSFKMAYRLYVPYNYDPDMKYPVTTLLHGAGQRGNDGLCQITAGFPLLFDNPENDLMFSSIVLAPQCPAEYRWVETDWSVGNYSTSAVAESKPLGAVYKMLSTMSERYSVDTDRFYVSGLSMGGFGTWDLIVRHTDMFAAAIPICGAGDATKASLLVDFPIHTFHGTADDIVPIKGTERMYNTIVRLGGTKIQYTPMEGYPHNVWDYAYGLNSEIEWLFSQSLSDRNIDGN